MTALDAFDMVSFAETFEGRLAAALEELSKREGREAEKAWLATAHRHVADARAGLGDVMDRALMLPELGAMRKDRARALQGAAVDAVEALHPAIASAGGARSPLLEAIFRNLKLPPMRRCDRDSFEAFLETFEKRLGSNYVRRMIADTDYAPVEPALSRLRTSFAEWRNVFGSAPLEADATNALRTELDDVASRLDIACRQARLLAEAALLESADIAEGTNVFEKPKRRPAKKAELELAAPSELPLTSEAVAAAPGDDEDEDEDEDEDDDEDDEDEDDEDEDDEDEDDEDEDDEDEDDEDEDDEDEDDEDEDDEDEDDEDEDEDEDDEDDDDEDDDDDDDDDDEDEDEEDEDD